MQDLVDTLASRIGQMAITGAPVTSIDRAETGEFRLSISNRLPVSAEAVVLALPAHQASPLLSEIAPDTSRLLRELQTAAAGTFSMAFRESDLTRPLSGYGMVIPREEREPFNALTISSLKFEGRAPAGWALLRLFFGGARSPETMTLDDDRLLALALDRLRSFLGITAKPELVRIHRWSTGSPQYDVGHLRRIKAIEDSLPQGLRLVGSSYTGVGIPDIVRSASEAADQMISTRAFVATV
jgi:oxygen-dependent protoporphyrinogen oxidase